MILLSHRAQDYAPGVVPVRFGIEIDVRDHIGIPCLAHDPIRTGSAPSLGDWLKLDMEVGERPAYAVNVKSDGMERQLVDLFKFYPSIWDRLFFFDGSYPAMRRLKDLNAPVAERISEEEHYHGHSHIIWLDRWGWHGECEYSPGPVSGKVYVPMMDKEGRKTEVYAVSPELHIPNCQPSFRRYWWRRFQEMDCAGICTDHWLDAEEFFDGSR